MVESEYYLRSKVVRKFRCELLPTTSSRGVAAPPPHRTSQSRHTLTASHAHMLTHASMQCRGRVHMGAAGRHLRAQHTVRVRGAHPLYSAAEWVVELRRSVLPGGALLLLVQHISWLAMPVQATLVTLLLSLVVSDCAWRTVRVGVLLSRCQCAGGDRSTRMYDRVGGRGSSAGVVREKERTPDPSACPRLRRCRRGSAKRGAALCIDGSP